MQRLTVAQRSFLVGDDVAGLVLDYGALLGRIRGADIVRLAVVDGPDEIRVALLLNTGTQLLMESAGEGPEPDNSTAEGYLRERLSVYEVDVTPPIELQLPLL